MYKIAAYPPAFAARDRFPLAHVTGPLDQVAEILYEGAAALVRGAAKAVYSVYRGHRVRGIVTELAALEDRTLADIGFSRSQIPAVAQFVADNPGADFRDAIG